MSETRKEQDQSVNESGRYVAVVRGGLAITDITTATRSCQVTLFSLAGMGVPEGGVSIAGERNEGRDATFYKWLLIPTQTEGVFIGTFIARPLPPPLEHHSVETRCTGIAVPGGECNVEDLTAFFLGRSEGYLS